VGANSVVIKDVPHGQTVVGIPGKVVQVREAGKRNPHGIDLDHHLIPDPVGKAISCLMDRINQLETQLQSVTVRGPGQSADECTECEAETLCESSEQPSLANDMKKAAGV
jgi:serine O-acetyltransferase